MKRARNIVDIVPDGNCLFRAIALHFYRDHSRHKDVRDQIVNGLLVNREFYTNANTKSGVYDENFVAHLTGGDSSFDAYVDYTSTLGTYGDTGCLEVFQKIHPDFGYRVWTAVPKSTKFTEGFSQMKRYGNNVLLKYSCYYLLVLIDVRFIKATKFYWELAI